MCSVTLTALPAVTNRQSSIAQDSQFDNEHQALTFPPSKTKKDKKTVRCAEVGTVSGGNKSPLW